MQSLLHQQTLLSTPHQLHTQFYIFNQQQCEAPATNHNPQNNFHAINAGHEIRKNEAENRDG
jgi:hypothetical protein